MIAPILDALGFAERHEYTLLFYDELVFYTLTVISAMKFAYFVFGRIAAWGAQLYNRDWLDIGNVFDHERLFQDFWIPSEIFFSPLNPMPGMRGDTIRVESTPEKRKATRLRYRSVFTMSSIEDLSD